MAMATWMCYGVVVMLGDGKGGLTLAPNSPIVMKEGSHPHTHGLAMGDLNGDRKLDLITVNNSDNDVSIAFGDGRGGFIRAPATFAVGPSPYPLALGDVNNDGSLDIIATTTATGPLRAQQLPSSFALTLLLNDGGGGFRASLLPLRTGQPWSVAVGDVNGDRKPDLVVTHHRHSSLTVLLGDGAGHFTESPNSPFDFGHDAFEVVLADANHDGRLDALAAAGEGVRVMLGDGRGNFKPAPGSPFLTGRGVWRLAVADTNCDGRLDVVTSNMESQSISILLGR
jgi:FG-GAP-like repeat